MRAVCHVTGSDPDTDKSKFKWRRVEGRAYYPPVLNHGLQDLGYLSVVRNQKKDENEENTDFGIHI